jgi:osmotically inducible protein OsmC
VTEGHVPGIDRQQFDQYAARAKEGCPVSRALGSVREMTLDATLAG